MRKSESFCSSFNRAVIDRLIAVVGCNLSSRIQIGQLSGEILASMLPCGALVQSTAIALGWRTLSFIDSSSKKQLRPGQALSTRWEYSLVDGIPVTAKYVNENFDCSHSYDDNNSCFGAFYRIAAFTAIDYSSVGSSECLRQNFQPPVVLSCVFFW